jgi:LPPG:FO 2-phospho-L-lactate transferase
VTDRLSKRLGIASRILPMTDAPVRTIVETEEGPLAFQDYFVGRQCNVVAHGFRFEGIDAAQPSPEVTDALRDEGLSAVFLCPSNPFVSLDPIFGVAGIREALARVACPVIGVSPIIGGAAVKGPAAKMLRELGFEVSALTVAERYRDILDGFVIDTIDAAIAPRVSALGMHAEVTRTLMTSNAERRTLAQSCLALAERLAAD